MTKVLVSGASGFIALHLIKQLLQKGYKVVGSARSLEKGERFARLLNNKNFSYEIAEDLATPGCFDNFVKNHPDATVFFHTASPLKYSDNIEGDLLQPAITGTLEALRAVKKYGSNIGKVVYTSSIAALFSVADMENPNRTATPESWNETTWEEALKDPLSGYFASKAFAEKAAWKFMRDEKPHFSLITTHPGYVFGPQAFDELVTDKLRSHRRHFSRILN